MEVDKEDQSGASTSGPNLRKRPSTKDDKPKDGCSKKTAKQAKRSKKASTSSSATEENATNRNTKIVDCICKEVLKDDSSYFQLQEVPPEAITSLLAMKFRNSDDESKSVEFFKDEFKIYTAGKEIRIKISDFVILRREITNNRRGRNKTEDITAQFHSFDPKNRTAHVQLYLPSLQTTVGKYGRRSEIMQVMECANVPIEAIAEKVEVSFNSIPEKGKFCRFRFCPKTGAILSLKIDAANPGCVCCRELKEMKDFLRTQVEEFEKTQSVVFEEETYKVGDCVRLSTDLSNPNNWLVQKIDDGVKIGVGDETYEKDRPELWRSANVKKRPIKTPKVQQVAKITQITFDVDNVPILKVLKFKREEGRVLHPNQLLPADQEETAPVSLRLTEKSVAGKAYVVTKDSIKGSINNWVNKGPNRFFEEFSLGDVQYEEPPDWPKPETKLKSMDVCSGVGGMSQGFKESGVASVDFAIDLDSLCIQAIVKNFKHATVFNESLKEVIKKIQEGDPKYLKMLLVKLLYGGTPCQGFSDLNKFPDSPKSQENRDVFFDFLRLVELIMPRFVVLENVVSIASYKNGMYVQLALRIFMELGYQCSVRVLQAGSYGVAQSRSRLFIQAAAKGEILPDFPLATHCSSLGTPPLTINHILVEGQCEERGAPFREVVAVDVLADMSQEIGVEVAYATEPSTPQQEQMRSGSKKLHNHLAKKLTPLEEMRLLFIPPGCNWTHLPNKVVKLSDGTWTTVILYHLDVKKNKEVVCKCLLKPEQDKTNRKAHEELEALSLIPFCMAHSADENGEWPNCIARVLNDRPFQIVTAQFHLMGKQGRIIHPIFNRLLTVREMARSQALPDWFFLCGLLVDMYHQVGNAVPPPFSFHIGHCVMKSADKKKPTSDSPPGSPP